MRFKLFLSFTLVILVSVTSVVLLARQNTFSEVRSFMYRGGMSEAGSIISDLEGYYRANGSWQGVESVFQSRRSGQGRGAGNPNSGSGMGPGMGGMMMGQRLRLADNGGNVIADTNSVTPGGTLSWSEKRSAIPLQDEGQIVGYLLPEGGIGINLAEERFLFNRLNNAAITAGVIAGSFSLLLAVILAYNLLKPVAELARASNRLGKGDLSSRASIKGNDELADLGRTFNHMADSLQQAEESRRAMTADIAHELRNPLAIQRANLEALKDGIYDLTPQNLDIVMEQNLILTRLVEDLHTLALVDAGQLTLEKTKTDIVSLVRRVVEKFQLQAVSQNVILTYEVESKPPGPVDIDPMRVEQILSNLLSNGLRFTPDGGRIELTVKGERDTVSVSVQDSGAGIPKDALPFIFERFYRADKSRSRSIGGSGLGLAIARQLAEAHKGTLHAENHSSGGAVFILSLPF